jgi:hypothetical protein
LSNDSASKPVFKKVYPAEKKLLFQQLTSEKKPVRIKISDQGDFLHIVPMHVDEGPILLCHYTADSKKLTENQKVVANFTISEERYFFSTGLELKSGWMVLDIGVDLFHFQRRSSARVHIPDEYDAAFSLTAHQEKSYSIDCHLKDVSSGGFKMDLLGDAPVLKSGETISGILRLGHRRPMELNLEVRFVRRQEESGSILQVVGTRILSMDYTKENKLLMMIMDLQRELQARYPKKRS